MEVIKELWVDTQDVKCLVKTENKYHMNLSSFFESFFCLKNPIFVSITSLHMPLFRRVITFSLFVGAVGVNMLEKDFKSFECSFSSYDELCLILSSCVKHFDGKNKNPLVTFEYHHSRFSVNVSTDFFVVISCNLAKLMLLESEIVGSFSIAKQKSTSRVDLIEEFNYPLKIKAGLALGKPVCFIPSNLRYCNFAFNCLSDVVSVSTGGARGNIVFSYDMIERKLVNSGYKRISYSARNNFSFSLITDDMTPYPFDQNLSDLCIKFCLQFLQKI